MGCMEYGVNLLRLVAWLASPQRMTDPAAKAARESAAAGSLLCQTHGKQVLHALVVYLHP